MNIFPTVAKNRDIALIWIGERSIFGGYKFREGYMPAFEGDEKFRGLPFVDDGGLAVCYKEV